MTEYECPIISYTYYGGRRKGQSMIVQVYKVFRHYDRFEYKGVGSHWRTSDMKFMDMISGLISLEIVPVSKEYAENF